MNLRFLKHPISFAFFAAMVIPGPAIGNPKDTEAVRHTIQTLPPEVEGRTDNLNDRFWLYLPKRYERASKEAPMPLIIYLHGSSRRGCDLAKVKANGLAPLMDKRDDFEFVVVSPRRSRNTPGKVAGNPMISSSSSRPPSQPFDIQ
jgi:poly(3-hydroxybutyrate) depolymerase